MQKISKKYKALVKELQNTLPKAEHEYFEIFAQRLLKSFIKSSYQEDSLHTIQTSLLHSWGLFYRRSTPYTVDFCSSMGTLLTLINDDRPFLLDSSLNALKNHGISPSFILHPVFGVQRDEQGVLTYLRSEAILKQSSKKNRHESCILLYFDQTLSPKQQEILNQVLLKTLKNVSNVVDHWDTFKHKCLDIKDHLSGEQKDFVQWLLQENFIFLGYQLYDQNAQQCSTLGLSITSSSLSDPYRFLQAFKHLENHISIQKTAILSDVHKTEFLDLIEIVFYDSQGLVQYLHQFYGLFTSASIARPIREVPLLRQKALQIFEDSDLQPEWHDGKILNQLLQTFPLSAFFYLETDIISGFITTILNQQNKKDPKIYIFENSRHSTVSCLIYVSVDRFSQMLTQQITQQFTRFFPHLKLTVSTNINENDYVWLYFVIALSVPLKTTNFKELEKNIFNVLKNWQDKLYLQLKTIHNENETVKIFQQFQNAFDFSYQERLGQSRLLEDIHHIQKILADLPQQNTVLFDFHHLPCNQTFQLFIYQFNGPIALSTILPILENISLQTLSEYSFKISLSDQTVSLQVLDLSCANVTTDTNNLKERLLEALQDIWQEKVENDGFNSLILKAGLTVTESIIFRAYAKYLRQCRFLYPQSFIEKTLSNYPDIIQSFKDLFYQRFAPQALFKVSKNFLANLKKKIAAVPQDEEQVLNTYLKLIMFTLRTSYFQTASRDFLSFKMDSKKLDFLPLPRPYCEIYIYAYDMEAVHLRGGSIARGGIRWSDRPEDFRTEILGLLKAQMTKNAIIVPTGSKGGFIIKSAQLSGAQAYQKMMKALLSLTDNRLQGQPIHPENVRCYDGFDPYLVVAADKGTASFSDFANIISKTHQFWLGDAFASGGSQGYDHKKLGITAQGGWESVKRHFSALGYSVTTTPFTVIGVGDMAGDVFGNGMLQSDKIKLIGAFNHKHIFIDPTPNPEISFKERQRMFNLTTSTWADYDLTQASAGARVFERNQKILHLSKEIRQVLGIVPEEVSPNDLIQRLLTFSVDLLWFGGIGTFVKGTKETHLDVNDKANDLIRINGQNLRCRVLVEGANLGITQLGRIEYALKGGFIYTDFIDNSAGVNCSDHEVNLKILLDQFVEKNIIVATQRDDLLKYMTPEITELVIHDNFSQALSLRIALLTAAQDLKSHLRLIKYFEGIDKINRSVEYICEDLLLIQRTGFKGRKGLTAPELAVLMAYTKNILKEMLLTSFTDETCQFDALFYPYFPSSLRQNYESFLNLHPLKTEITVTSLVNLVVNMMGCPFIQECLEQKIPLPDIFCYFFLIYKLFSLQDLWTIVHKTELEEDIQFLIFQEIQKWVRYCCHLFFIDKNNYTIFSMHSDLILNHLLNQIPEYLQEDQRSIILKNQRRFIRKKMPEVIQKHLQKLSYSLYLFDLLPIIHATQLPSDLVTATYFMLTDICGFYWLYNKAYEIPIENKWQKQALTDVIQDIHLLQQHIVIQMLQKFPSITFQDVESTINQWQEAKADDLQQVVFLIDEIKTIPSFDFSTLTVVVRQLKKIML